MRFEGLVTYSYVFFRIGRGVLAEFSVRGDGRGHARPIRGLRFYQAG